MSRYPVSAGGGSSYTNEEAQDAVGTILVDTATIDFTYDDATPQITASVIDGSITYAKIQDVSATSRFLGRITAGAGGVEELTAANAKTILALAQADITGLTTADSPQFTALQLGHASDTTFARSAAGKATIEGNLILAIADPNADRVLIWDDSAGDYVAATLQGPIEISGTTLRVTEIYGIALSDETTAITTGTNKATFSLPFAFTITSVYATLNTASSSGTPTVDINEAGTTILSTKLTIDANEKTSATAASAAVISDASIAANAELGFDIDTAGTGAKGLKVFIQGYRT